MGENTRDFEQSALLAAHIIFPAKTPSGPAKPGHRLTCRFGRRRTVPTGHLRPHRGRRPPSLREVSRPRRDGGSGPNNPHPLPPPVALVCAGGRLTATGGGLLISSKGGQAPPLYPPTGERSHLPVRVLVPGGHRPGPTGAEAETGVGKAPLALNASPAPPPTRRGSAPLAPPVRARSLLAYRKRGFKGAGLGCRLGRRWAVATGDHRPL